MDFLDCGGGIAFFAIFSIFVLPFIVGLTIVLYAINRNYRRREIEHRERMLAIEKGQPIPVAPPAEQRKTRYPFAWPFALIGLGLGLILIFLLADGDTEALGFGFVSLFIGLGLLASRLYGVKKDSLAEKEINYSNNYSNNITSVSSKENLTETSSNEEIKEE